ncbi:MAG TPA: M48 family metallopeptidase [Candidatus Synoicihabitans sp.]|nr:M48 family metallopeptidase [Candidatus Synoicihabitans sp.]
MRHYRSFPLVLLLATLVGCSTVPETGRRQLMLVSPEQEAQMGLSAFSQIKQEEKISNDSRYNAQVQRIGQRIAESVGREIPNAEWEFVVFESEDINAFALPGGKVGVYTGLLKLAGSDDEVACVIGHEIAHVTSRHGAERTSQNQLAAGVGMLGAIGLSMSDMEPGKRNAILGLYGAGATVGVLLPYARTHETEADTIGLRFAAGAGYDPRAAAQFWRKMQAANERSAKPPEFLSTHPSDDRRIATLEQLAPEYMALYESAKARYE